MSRVFAFLKNEFRRHCYRIWPDRRRYLDRDHCQREFGGFNAQHNVLGYFDPAQVNSLRRRQTSASLAARKGGFFLIARLKHTTTLAIFATYDGLS